MSRAGTPNADIDTDFDDASTQDVRPDKFVEDGQHDNGGK